MIASRRTNFMQAEVMAIDPALKTVSTKSSQVAYDYLVIALGAEMAPDLLPGLAGTGHDLHDMESVVQFKAALEKMEKGTVAIAVSSLPFKCPPSPYEYALIADDVLRKRGARAKVRVVLTTPEPQPMPVAGKAVGDAVKGMLTDRGIDYRPLHKPTAVDPKTKRVTYENGAQLACDLLGAVYPQRAPKIVRDANLTDASGFIPANLNTFETAVPGIYAIGDCASLKLPDGRPHPKAGVFSEAQAVVLAKQLGALALGGGELARYAGTGVCFVDAGGDLAAAAEANLLAPGGPQFTLAPPSKEGLTRKKQFEAERLKRWFGS
jgi:sulfide:quinone oxidoreductase